MKRSYADDIAVDVAVKPMPTARAVAYMEKIACYVGANSAL